MSLTLDASFGVFSAFVVFCALFGRQAVLILLERVKNYQAKERDALQTAEVVLKDAEACFKEAQQEAEEAAAAVSAIHKSVKTQTTHLKKNAEQELEVFKARTKENTNKDLEKLKATFKHELEQRALADVIAGASQKMHQAPLGSLRASDNALKEFFQKN